MISIMLVVPAMAIAASVLAAAVLSTGQLSTGRFREVALSSLQDTGSGLLVDGPVYARTDGTSMTQLMIDVTTLPGGLPVNLDPTAATNRTVVMYADAANLKPDLPYSVTWIGGGNGDANLDSGEHAEIVVDMSGMNQAGDSFTVEVRPAHGIRATIQRAIPTGHLPAILQLW